MPPEQAGRSPAPTSPKEPFYVWSAGEIDALLGKGCRAREAPIRHPPEWQRAA